MDELIGYLIVAGLVIAAIIAALILLFYAGLIVIGGIALIGAISGCVVAAKNFFQVLAEAHSKVPGAPGGSTMVEKLFVAFFVLVLVLIGISVGLLLNGNVNSVAQVQPAGQAAPDMSATKKAEEEAAAQRSAVISAALAAEHQRVEREAEGVWIGEATLVSMIRPVGLTEHPYLKVLKNGSEIQGILRSGLKRVDYVGQLVDQDQAKGDPTVLLLTPVKVSGDGGPSSRDSGLYSPVFAVPKLDGTFHVWSAEPYAHGPNMKMQRFTAERDDTGETLDELFADRLSQEIEFVPARDLGLYYEPGDLVWDSLSLSEVKAKQLRLFDTGLAATTAGIEFRHVVMRGPNDQERKAWIKWE